MNKQIIIIFLFVFLSSINICAKDYFLIGYIDAGKQYSFEDYKDLLLDDEYKYTNYNLKFEQKISPSFNYYVSSLFYSRNYISKNIYDNKGSVITTSLSFDKNKFYKMAFDVKYKEKSVVNNSKNNYKQIKLDTRISRDVENQYSLKFTGGINNFDYVNISSGNIFNVLAKVDANKYFKGEDITLGGMYKIESADKKFADRKQVKQEVKGLFDYKLRKDYFYQFTSKFEYGRRDTKDDDEIDYDIDYTFKTYSLKTYHKINDDIKTNVKYENIKEDYINSELSCRRFLIGNTWSYDILNSDIKRIWMNISGEYRQKKYIKAIKNNYNTKQFACDANYKSRDNYKLYLSAEDNIYKHEDISKNKNIYNFIAGIEKYLLNKDLTLCFEYKYKYIDYELKNNVGQNGSKISFDWKF
jgi:hypothetical protein